MIGVKLTVLMIVITIISVFYSRVRSSAEDIETKIKMMDGVFPKYVTFASVLVLISIIGIIYSTIYFLFFA